MELLGRAQFDAVITYLRRFENGSSNINAGVELTQQIRRINSQIPIFVYTMNIDQSVRQSALASGVTYITTSPTELQSMLKRHL